MNVKQIACFILSIFYIFVASIYLSMHKFSFVLIFFAIVFLSCNEKKSKEVSYDFQQIIEGDTLRVLTLNTSTSYFLYRDQPMGYHYDMISDFCFNHNLTPKVIVADNITSLYEMLQDSIGDVIIYNVPITNQLKDSLLFCGLEEITHQVLVQRAESKDTILQDVTELIGKEVTVLENSKYKERMNNLNDEVGGGISVAIADSSDIVVEDLIRMVSAGLIRYTVADEHVAKINSTYFRNLNVKMPVSFEQRSSWAVRKNTPILADSLNSWFQKTNTQPIYRQITKRYFEEAKGYSFGRPSYVSILAPGQISPFDAFFKEYGEEFGIDWRLLASIAFYESRFNNDVKSWAGAAGLMGLMPATAESLGLKRDELYIPEKNIRTGAKLLNRLINIFSSVENKEERIKLALAAYNGGIGHIYDARALAEKYDADKNVWSGNVEKFLQMKRLEQYYKDPVCKNGYFRSDETVNYVRNVMNGWETYKQKVKE